ncbi:hypothetical protein B9Z19DRAFT_1121619 [Tuber borchii]|uniref:Uncharacterized protein n=1 Tax=Tuber borchii TaxID=42251 RepID=A0A2T7A287_TUBBO|nr:hypothetical protein B9Z19DRAFT_1121619 [Tuber borchii]
MRQVKPSETQIAALSTALGQEGCGGPSDCVNSSAGGVIYGKEVRKEYYTPRMHLESERSDDEDPMGLAPLGKEVNRSTRPAPPENVENTTTVKSIPESSEKRKVVIISAPK